MSFELGTLNSRGLHHLLLILLLILFILLVLAYCVNAATYDDERVNNAVYKP
jgi:hypothetical protein